MNTSTHKSYAAGVITLPQFARGGDGVWHYFGTRRQSAVRAVEDGSLIAIGVTQAHGTDVLVVDRPVQAGATFSGAWDALVTDQVGVLVTVRTADCVPILLHDVRLGVVAAIHAGWRGAVAGILPSTLAVMQHRFGSRPDTVRMAIGPSAGACCYEIDEPVLGPLRKRFADWRQVITPVGPDTARLDLRRLMRRHAVELGVLEERVHVAGVCTICHPELFYSYRREGRVSGTMLSGIALVRPARRRAARGA